MVIVWSAGAAPPSVSVTASAVGLNTYPHGVLIGRSLSQQSPTLSCVLSTWSGLNTNWQLSLALGTPSLSLSVSQASPWPSPSLSHCSPLCSPASMMPLPLQSLSCTLTLGRVGQLSQASPSGSLSLLI